jgi:hypothetical protein
MPASLESQIASVREQIREKELEILNLKQKFTALKEKRPPSKLKLCEETYLENIDQPRSVVVRMFVNEHKLSAQTASSYYSSIKQRVARRRSTEEAELQNED